MEFQR